MLNRRYRSSATEDDPQADDDSVDLMVVNLTNDFGVRPTIIDDSEEMTSIVLDQSQPISTVAPENYHQ